MHFQVGLVISGLVSSLLVSVAMAASPPPAAYSVLVDTKTLALSVMAGRTRVIARFENIALGSGGVANLHRAGDATTPRGTYHVIWINRESRFGTFYGLDYPRGADAELGYRHGIIDRAAYDAIVEAERQRHLAPQETGLGGGIGIHGVGQGDPRVQRRINWTDGCIALSNEQIAALAKWVHIGTPVTIR